MFLILVSAFVILYAAPGAAQGMTIAGSPGARGEVLSQPLCFNIKNTAPYSVLGHVATDYYTNEQGQSARHRSNFRLQNNEQAELCTAGPFYQGRRVELVLRSLLPLFDCKTSALHDVIIRGERKPEGGTRTWAECY